MLLLLSKNTHCVSKNCLGKKQIKPEDKERMKKRSKGLPISTKFTKLIHNDANAIRFELALKKGTYQGHGIRGHRYELDQPKKVSIGKSFFGKREYHH